MNGAARCERHGFEVEFDGGEVTVLEGVPVDGCITCMVSQATAEKMAGKEAE